MKKKILLLAVLMTAILVGCSGKDTPAAADPASPASPQVESAAQDADYPLYSDFDVKITEPVDVSGYGKFTATNNSKYATVYVKELLRKADGVEIVLTTTESLLPGETSPAATFICDTPGAEAAEFTPIWLEVKYLDADKTEHSYRYDYKLDQYDHF